MDSKSLRSWATFAMWGGVIGGSVVLAASLVPLFGYPLSAQSKVIGAIWGTLHSVGVLAVGVFASVVINALASIMETATED